MPHTFEQGLKDFDLVAWFMLYAPASTQPAMLDRLRKAAAASLASPEVAAKLQEQGIEQRALASAELVAFNRAELDKWGTLVKRAGAQVD